MHPTKFGKMKNIEKTGGKTRLVPYKVPTLAPYHLLLQPIPHPRPSPPAPPPFVLSISPPVPRRAINLPHAPVNR
jgi:hypothetical protein